MRIGWAEIAKYFGISAQAAHNAFLSVLKSSQKQYSREELSKISDAADDVLRLLAKTKQKQEDAKKIVKDKIREQFGYNDLNIAMQRQLLNKVDERFAKHKSNFFE